MSVIDDIKNRLDIVEIIGQHVQLRRTGKAYLGFCPFHSNTRTPAFTVYPDSQSFYCFGCHASGTIFDFVMRQQGLDFRDALQQLADRAGVQLRERTPEEQHIDQKRTRLLEIAALAARYFNYILLQHKRGQPGRDYLAQRDITQESIEAFQLGYSINEWSHLLAYLTERKGYTHEEALEAGLAVHREEGGWYDRFRGRLMFPIRNAKGEVVGFGGRAIGDAQPKYLNTPQTLLFDKSHVLYGIDLARDAIRSNDACVVVEGYVDVLTAHQHGFRNVVAPLGTAMTAGHVAMLKKLSTNIYLALDADAAGQKATLRGVSTLQNSPADDAGEAHPIVTAQGMVRWENDITLRIIKMPPGQDPDEVIKADPQRWRDLVAQAVPVVEFYIDAFTADLNLNDQQHQRIALDRLLPIIAQLDGTNQRVSIARLEQVVGIRAELILDLVKSTAHAARRKQHSTAAPSHPHNQRPQPGQQQLGHTSSSDPYLIARGHRSAPTPSHEDYLLTLILRYPTVNTTIQETIDCDAETYPNVRDLLGNDPLRLFEKTENRMIWQAWLDAGEPPLPTPTEETPDSLVDWAQELDETLRKQIEYLATLVLPRPTEYKYQQDAESCTRQLRIKQVRRWQHRLSQQAGTQDNDEDEQHILTLLTELNRYLAHLSAPPVSKGFHDMRQTVEKEML